MTYTYACKKCKKQDDKQHGMNESPIFVCCNETMVKLISRPLAIHGANTGTRKGT